MFTFSITRRTRKFHVVVVLLMKPIAFLTFPLSLPSSLLKLPIGIWKRRAFRAKIEKENFEPKVEFPEGWGGGGGGLK